MELTREELEAYIVDRENVFGDPDRFGLATIVTYIRREGIPVTVDYVLSTQKELDMSLSRKKIKNILNHWKRKGYVNITENNIQATDKLRSALAKDGITEESLDRMGEALSSIEDHNYVLNNSDRVDIGAILAYILNSGADLNSISKIQERISSKMPEDKIKSILDEWIEKGYANFSVEGKYRGTEKLSEALKRINMTKDRLLYLSKLK